MKTCYGVAVMITILISVEAEDGYNSTTMSIGGGGGGGQLLHHHLINFVEYRSMHAYRIVVSAI